MRESRLILSLFLAALLGAVFSRWIAPAPVQAQSADGDRRYVAVAAEYQTGVSLLYVLDQQTERLAVYEARGGASNSHRVSLVGVRNVGLDSQLDGFNDESDYSYKDLQELLERRGVPTPEGN
jgi:hypothetical protein